MILIHRRQVEAAGEQVDVTFHDAILGMKITVTADNLSLSTGMIADNDSTEELAMIFKLPRTSRWVFS